MFVAAVLLSSTYTVSSADIWGEVEGDRVSVGGEQATEVSSDGDEAGTVASSAAHGPVTETRYVIDCPGALPDVETNTDCIESAICPSDDDDPPLRYRIFQRDLDPVTAEPLTGWQMVGTECRTDPEDFDPVNDGPTLAELVVREWESTQIPAAEIGISPPDGRTLINFDTIFHTTAGPQTYEVTLLGQPVTIYAVPVDFTWHHGDGTTQTTTTPGAPYPSAEITHAFTAPGTVNPRVDVRYRAEFTVAGGSPQPIPGVAEVTGLSEDVVILQARTRLVDP